MSLQDRLLDAQAWDVALREAQRGDTAPLEFKLRTSETVPEAVRLWLADRVRLLGRQGPGRRTALPEALLMMECARYASCPPGKKKVFVLEASDRYGIAPAVMATILRRGAGRTPARRQEPVARIVKRNQEKKPR